LRELKDYKLDICAACGKKFKHWSDHWYNIKIKKIYHIDCLMPNLSRARLVHGTPVND